MALENNFAYTIFDAEAIINSHKWVFHVRMI